MSPSPDLFIAMTIWPRDAEWALFLSRQYKRAVGRNLDPAPSAGSEIPFRRHFAVLDTDLPIPFPDIYCLRMGSAVEHHLDLFPLVAVGIVVE